MTEPPCPQPPSAAPTDEADPPTTPRSRRSRAGWLPRDARTRRRLNGWAAVTAFAVLVGVQGSDFALVSPGPAPDLTAAVNAAQDQPGPLGHGRLLATTISATRANWFEVAACAVRPGCLTLQVRTDDPDAQQTVSAEMALSKKNAATVARTLTQGASSQPGRDVSHPGAHLDADLGEVGGPSAGLMLSLAFVDELTGGDLTAGQRIAGTGTVSASGTVGRISGISRKVQGAQQAGAQVFFAPAEQEEEAASAATPGLRVVPVSSVAQALRWLCGHGGQGSGAC